MKSKLLKLVSLIIAMACILCFPAQASATAQGTNGTEMDVVQAQQLEIHLGKAWSGVAFQLKTDVGSYPDAIPVGEDGVLLLEIGGSSSYILTCMDPSTVVPTAKDDLNVQDTEPAQEETIQTSEATEAATEPASEETAQALTVAGIPISQIIIFGVGLLVALAVLVFMQMHKTYESEEADEEDV